MSTPLTDEQLAAIKARADKATPPPWLVDDHGRALGIRGVCTEDHALDIDFGCVSTRTKRDAEFIARARQDVPALLAEVERLKAERRQAVVAYETCRDAVEDKAEYDDLPMGI